MRPDAEGYELLAQQLESLFEGERDLVANLSNASAALNDAMDGVNWVGFYRLVGGELVLGPFQGRPACIRIPVGRGVCGTAVAEDAPQLVTNVHEFPGHIACDVASNSEVVIPLHVGGQMVGVLDIDSPELGRFDQTDLAGLQRCAAAIESAWATS